MKRALRILMIEDNEDDALLVLRALRKGPYDLETARVATREALDKALDDQTWDLIICDHMMPGFTSLLAIETVRSRGLDLPFIVVSGAAPEDVVTDAMRAGAHDFISKNGLVRLLPAIQRELREADVRKERRQIASRLLESEGRYESLFNENPSPMLLVDASTLLVVDANQTASTYFGHPLASLKETSIMALSSLAQAGGWRSIQRIKEQRSYQFEDRVLLSDGSTREVDVRAVKIQQGPRTMLLATLFDQTERKAAEQALQESESRFRTLADSTPMLIWTAGLDGKRDYFNRTWLDFTGKTMEDELRDGWIHAVHPDDVSRCLGSFMEAFRKRRAFQSEFRLRRHDDVFRWVVCQGTPRFTRNGEFTGYVGSIMDITERRDAEEGMARLAAAVEQVVDGIAIMDASGNIEYINQAFERMTGLGLLAIQGWALTDLLDHKDVERAVEQARRGESWEGRVSIQFDGGSPKELDITCSPVRNPRKTLTNLVVVMRDITAEQEMERQLRQSHKMDALGSLAAGIAHDFNNLLTTILTASQLVQEHLAFDSPLRSKVQAIHQAGLCAAGLTKQILSFSRKSDEKRRPLDLSALVKNALQMLTSTKPPSVTIESQLTSGIWVEGDPSLIHQVLLNLAVNAFQAMGTSGGLLQITLSEAALSEDTPHSGLAEGRYALLTVRDTGCGMDAATQERIFDPFFTTKQGGEGTGLGLSMVLATINKAGGAIKVQSRPGEGSTFQIHWPCASVHEIPTELEPLEDIRGHETFLFVDDEELIAVLAKSGLQDLGYTVTTCTHPQQALDEFRVHPFDFDLVFTDLSMPGMNGAELAARLLELRPDLPILMVSGLPMATTLSLSSQVRLQGVVPKPCLPQDLATAARRILGTARPKPQEAHGTASERASRSRKGALILLAEDSHMTRGMIKSWLEKAGYEVRPAQDGMEAWDLFMNGPDRNRFDLVLTDVVMPRLDGLDLAHLVRKLDPSVPIAVLTSNEDKETVKSALHLGVKEFLNKPFEAPELLACVERLISEHTTRVAERRSSETAQAVRMAQRTMVAVPEKGMPLYSLYEPLTDAGGDVFRCTACADGSILFILADVAGHSVLSSYAVASFLGMLPTFVTECVALMALPQGDPQWDSCIRSCGLIGRLPCDPLRHLAMKFNRGIQGGPFSEIPVCALIGRWNPRNGNLHLLNAGIPHALLSRSHGGSVEPIEINGTPLGIFTEPELEEAQFQLSPGDRLLLGTDGFFDVTSTEGVCFEAQAIARWKALQAEPIDVALGIICEQVRVHGGGIIPDDLLVVAFEQPALLQSAEAVALRFPSSPHAIDAACTHLEGCIRHSSMGPHISPSRTFDILMAVREALTNALIHGNHNRLDSWIEVTCDPDPETSTFVISVADEGPGFDLASHSPPEDPLSERGRGIPLIRAFARDIRMDGSRLTMTFPAEEETHDDQQTAAAREEER